MNGGFSPILPDLREHFLIERPRLNLSQLNQKNNSNKLSEECQLIVMSDNSLDSEQSIISDESISLNQIMKLNRISLLQSVGQRHKVDIIL